MPTKFNIDIGHRRVRLHFSKPIDSRELFQVIQKKLKRFHNWQVGFVTFTGRIFVCHYVSHYDSYDDKGISKVVEILQSLQDCIFCEVVSDNVERNYANRYDCRFVRA